MLTIYPLTLWYEHVLIENFWSKINFPKIIINSFQTSWNKLAKLSIRKLTLTSYTLYIQFHDVGTYELLPISQKPLKISNWNFTCILQRHIGIRKYRYLNFDQVPHLDPKSHGWSQFTVFGLNIWTLRIFCDRKESQEKKHHRKKVTNKKVWDSINFFMHLPDLQVWKYPLSVKDRLKF